LFYGRHFVIDLCFSEVVISQSWPNINLLTSKDILNSKKAAGRLTKTTLPSDSDIYRDRTLIPDDFAQTPASAAYMYTSPSYAPNSTGTDDPRATL
jgi:hypothetical protein